MRYQQPQSLPQNIDSTSPLAKGLAVLSNGPFKVNLVSGRIPVTSGPVTVAAGRFGLARTFFRSNGAQDAHQVTGFTGDLTFFLVGGLTQTLAGSQTLLSGLAGANTRFSVGEQSNNAMTFSTAPSGGSTVNLAGPGVGSVGDAVWVARLSGGSMTLYRNGVLFAGPVAQAGVNWSDLTQFTVGSTAFLGNPAGNVYLAGYATRGWSDADIALFSANPWQLFKSPQRALRLVAGADTTLAGAAPCATSCSTSLTTAIPLVGSASVGSIGTAALAAPAANLAGAASAIASVSAALSTAIQIAGAAGAMAGAAGALTTAIGLTGTAAGTSSAAGALTTGITMAGVSAATAAGSGSLATAIALSGVAGTAASASGAMGGAGAMLSGAAACASIGAAALSTAIPLGGGAAATVVATGIITAPGAGLSGTAAARATTSGTLTTGIPLAGAAIATGIAVGALAGGAAALSGTAATGAMGAAMLSTGIALIGAAGSSVFAPGQLTTAIRLNGSALCAGLASASLEQGDLEPVLDLPESRIYRGQADRRIHRGQADCRIHRERV